MSPIRFLSNAMEKICDIFSTEREVYPSTMAFNEARRNPKKYSGYPEFAKMLAASGALPIVRRFDRLSLRVMLRLQDELTEIEEQLDAIDKTQMSRETPQDINNGTFRADPVPERNRLLQTAHEKLERYHRFMHKYSKLLALAEPHQGAINNLRNWIDHNSRWDTIDGEDQLVDGPINSEELEFLNGPDLIPIVPDQRSPFRKFMNRSELLRRSKFLQTEIPDSLKPNVDDGTLILTDDAKLLMSEKVLSGLVGLVMLVLPMWVLSLVDGFYTEVGIVTAFACTFCCIVWASTTARPYESLAAPAMYVAFLVLFLLAKERT